MITSTILTTNALAQNPANYNTLNKYNVDTTYVTGKSPRTNPIYHTAEAATLKSMCDYILFVHQYDSINAGSYSLPTVGTAGSYGGVGKYTAITTDAYGRVSGVTAGTQTISYSNITGTPTTLSGYGITDGVSTGSTYANPSWLTSLAWSKITGAPTTLTLSSFSASSPIAYNNSTGAFSYDYTYPGTYTALQAFTAGIAIASVSATPSTPATGYKFYAASNNALSWKGANGFVRTLDGTANTADRAYLLPDHNCTIDNLTTATTTSLTGFLKGNGSTISAATLSTGDLPAGIAYTANTLAQFTPTTSAGFSGQITDATGTGKVVFATNPTLGGFTLTDATNIALGATTGTKIGTATSQKIGFFNATPVAQQSGNLITSLSALGLVTSGSIASADLPTITLSGDVTGSGAVGAITTSLSTSYTRQSATYTTTTSCTPATTVSNSNSTVFVTITAQSGALTLVNPTGAWANGQLLEVRITATGATTPAITYGTIYNAGSAAPLVTTMVAGKSTYLLFQYNSNNSKFDCLASLSDVPQ